MMHKPAIVALAAAFLLAVATQAPAMAQSDSEAEVEGQVEVPAPPGEGAPTDVVGGATLYQRIGGYDSIAGIVDDVLARMAGDDRLQGHFADLDEDTMRQLRQDTVDFVCEKTGGPCFYTGSDLVEAHAGTGIGPADWERASELMAAALDAGGVQGELRDEIGAFLAGFREDIVGDE